MLNFKTWLENEEIIPAGDCFRFATKLGTEMLADGIIENPVIVHAIVHPTWHHREYPHAWVEAKGRCYDWQLKMTGKGSLPIKEFYELYNPDTTRLKKYSPGKAVGMMARNKHHGPWEI